MGGISEKELGIDFFSISRNWPNPLPTGIVSRSYPRLSAMAERLWSPYETTNDLENAFPRLDQFRCIMVNRGIPAEPIGVPSSCNVEFNIGYKPVWEENDDKNSQETLKYSYKPLLLSLLSGLIVSSILL